MKIFIVKGLIKGMVKIDSKLHFVGGGFDKVCSVILFDGNKIKVLEKEDFALNITAFNAVSVVLLNESKKILCSGSSCGKVDIDKIMFEYNKIVNSEKQDRPTVVVNKKHNVNDIAQENIVENATKIDPRMEIDSKMPEDYTEVLQEVDAISEDEVQSYKENDVQSFEQLINESIYEKDDEIEFVSLDDIPTQSFDEQDADELIIGSSEEDLEMGSKYIMQNIKNSKNNYYAEIKADLDKFFTMHPKNEELEKQVWGSKWVKIKADYDYSVGVIFDDGTPSIIAYAIPYEDINQIDMDNLEFGEWLKVNDKSNENRGYFVYYQNALTGEMIVG